MNNSMINSLVGMHALQQKLDSISNNLANMNSTAYKSRDVYFQEILTNRIEQPKAFNLKGRMTSLGLDQGYGARTSLTQANFGQGTKMDTGLSTDFMLQGDNIFFTLLPANSDPFNPSEIHYTKNGHFQLDANRYLVTDSGDFVLSTDDEPIYIPEGADFSVNSQGRVIAHYGDGTNEEIGAMKITKIDYPQSLEEIGNSKFKIPQKLIDENVIIVDDNFDMLDETTTNGQYAVMQGSLEGANVDLAKEMVDLNQTQRAYQFLARGLSISDQMLGIANNLKG